MREPAKLDDLDCRLLARLQEDARVSTAELARQFKLSPPGVQKRLRRLEEKGVIERYVTWSTARRSAWTCCASSS